MSEKAGYENRESKRSDREEGSAVVEFVLIATPLFLPALLFFMAMQNTAMEEIRVQNLARQTVRAFVTADSVTQGINVSSMSLIVTVKLNLRIRKDMDLHTTSAAEVKDV